LFLLVIDVIYWTSSSSQLHRTVSQ